LASTFVELILYTLRPLFGGAEIRLPTIDSFGRGTAHLLFCLAEKRW
jgi:hypothetical protein